MRCEALPEIFARTDIESGKFPLPTLIPIAGKKAVFDVVIEWKWTSL